MKQIKVISTFITLLLVIESIVVFGLRDFGIFSSTFLEVQTSLIYLCWLLFFLKKYGFSNIFCLFLICFGMFNLSRIMLSPFLGLNYKVADSLIYINLTQETVQKSLIIFSIFTFFSCFFYIIYKSSNIGVKQKTFELSYNPKLYQIGKWIMLTLFLIVIYTKYIEVTSSIGKNYYDIYKADNAQTPIYIRLIKVLFHVGFMIILLSKPKLKIFLFFSTLFVLTLAPDLIMGVRSSFAVTIIALFWIVSNVYNVHISGKRVILVCIPIIFLLQVVSINRSSNNTETSNILQAVPQFFYDQSQSMHVLTLYIQYQNQITNYNYPYIIDPLINGFLPSGQSLETIEKRSSLGHQLTYSLNPTYYFAGKSLGSSFLGELYEFGLFGIFVGSALFSYFIKLFEYNYKRNRFILFLSPLILNYILIAPRATFLPSVYIFGRYLIVLILIAFVFKIKLRTRIKKGT